MKIEKDFAPVTIRIETREEYNQFVDILKAAASIQHNVFANDIRDHAYHLLKKLKEA